MALFPQIEALLKDKNMQAMQAARAAKLHTPTPTISTTNNPATTVPNTPTTKIQKAINAVFSSSDEDEPSSGVDSNYSIIHDDTNSDFADFVPRAKGLLHDCSPYGDVSPSSSRPSLLNRS